MPHRIVPRRVHLTWETLWS